MRQLHNTMSWAIPSRPQSSAWRRLPSCGRTSSTTPKQDLCMMPIVRPGTAKSFWKNTGSRSHCTGRPKATFDEAGLKKLPKVKELNTEYSTLLSQKKAAYPAYRKARDEMQELMKAQKNVEIFFIEEKATKEKAQTR